MTDQNVIKGSAPEMHVAYNAATNRQTTDTADLNGNIGSGYTYDIENRLLKAGTGMPQFGYDAGNKRIARDTEFTFWAGNQKWETYTTAVSGSSVTFTLTGVNVYFGGRLIAKGATHAAATSIAQDRLGSMNGKFYPFGQERPSATTNDKEKFTGYFRDSATGLDYADQRYHQPGVGRFMTPDPYAGSARPGDAGSWNRYAYVSGDPANRVDPSGLDDLCGGPGYGPCGPDPYQDAIESFDNMYTYPELRGRSPGFSLNGFLIDPVTAVGLMSAGAAVVDYGIRLVPRTFQPQGPCPGGRTMGPRGCVGNTPAVQTTMRDENGNIIDQSELRPTGSACADLTCRVTTAITRAARQLQTDVMRNPTVISGFVPLYGPLGGAWQLAIVPERGVCVGVGVGAGLGHGVNFSSLGIVGTGDFSQIKQILRGWGGSATAQAGPLTGYSVNYGSTGSVGAWSVGSPGFGFSYGYSDCNFD